MTEEYSELSQTSKIEVFSKIMDDLILKYKRIDFPLAVMKPYVFGMSFTYVNCLFSLPMI